MEKVSTCDAMYQLIGQISQNLEKNKKTIAVFLDLAKAFDTVPHGQLIDTLESYGVRGVVLEVFRSYLTKREQKVKIRDTYSDTLNIKIGIPQGTVLGPILFITYINSLTNIRIQGSVTSYADDTVLLFSGDTWGDVKRTVSSELIKVKNWLDNKKLTLNTEKTKYVAFSLTMANRPDYSSIFVENFQNEIKEVPHIKYLGVIIDRHLKWEEQVLKLKNSIRKLIHKFYQIRESMGQKLLISIYKALIESLLRYGIIVWGGLYNNVLEQLNVAQNYILKIIYKKSRLYPTQQLYNDQIFNVRSLYILETCIFVYKQDHFKKYVNHDYQTRINIQKNLQIPQSKSTMNLRFLNYLGPKFFNLLPLELRNATSLKKFIKNCKCHIFDRNEEFVKLLK